MDVAGPATGRLDLWMIYPFMVLVGVSWVTDMTSRRALIYDLVGAERIDHAMSLEMLSSASGLAVGALLGGAVIEALGIASAFVTVALMFTGALVLFVLVPQPRKNMRPASGLIGAWSLLYQKRAKHPFRSVNLNTSKPNAV